MSTTPSQHNDNQEIDLGQVSRKIGDFFEKIAQRIFVLILFLKRNLILLVVLFISGAVLGFFLDAENNKYNNQIIVTPNFSSTDYLYSKIDLINAKNNEGDTIFLTKVVGIKDPKTFKGIDIDPITDIYRFVAANPVNFDFIKLLGEDGDMSKIVLDRLTSRNYLYSNITFVTSELTDRKKTVDPIMNYLNDSDYYRKLQKEQQKSLEEKMKANDSTITQINNVLNSFAKEANGSGNKDKLVYYNENTQLNDVIKTKNDLLNEQAYRRIERVNYDKIIKECAANLNMQNMKGLNGKLKLILPFLFVGLFMAVVVFRNFYKKQMAKFKANQS